MKTDLYQTVTDAIVVALEQGNIPWICPWQVHPDQALPANLASGHRYRGVNVLLLNMVHRARGFRLNRWMTFQQARSLGAHVRRGESGTSVVFFKMLEVESERPAPPDADSKVIPLLRSFTVFNADQIEGLPADLIAEPPALDTFEANQAAEGLIQASGAVIRHGGGRAFYRPSDDTIQLPAKASFISPERYYGVALHELTHWSGHESRCNRKLAGRQNLDAYAFEELVAELGAAFLCSHVGIHTELQHAAYLEAWLTALKGDKRLIFSAASLAQRACDYLIPKPPIEAVEAQEDTAMAIAA